MIFKVWQCSTHKTERANIGVNDNSFGKDLRNAQEEDCPFCIIADLKQQFEKLQAYIKCN